MTRKCAWCGRPLSGVSDGRKLPLSWKRVERLYGGYLCHACLREAILRWVVKEAAASGPIGQSSA
ncbi:hypothetical protein HRbin02_00491 [Candidatus Calditenuaceae archaeon HR02]|nr:hypothetical protein HRbin02_00491 [Candidatus Calditenuaceae archaeon HR02]